MQVFDHQPYEPAGKPKTQTPLAVDTRRILQEESPRGAKFREEGFRGLGFTGLG